MNAVLMRFEERKQENRTLTIKGTCRIWADIQIIFNHCASCNRICVFSQSIDYQYFIKRSIHFSLTLSRIPTKPASSENENQ
ncbi:MAG: hypothetical protein RIS64_2223 [Bacteroidota bacterium]|jgi:hypothetical protein